jgi:hypothetical protein
MFHACKLLLFSVSVRTRDMGNNYLFDKKKVKLFFTGFFSSAKNSRFITSAGEGVGARVIKRMFLTREQKIRWKKVFLFLSDMKFCFMKRLLPRPR